MHPIAVTRFNTKTWRENRDWVRQSPFKCGYGSPVRISDTILPEQNLYVIEMHNDLNKITGIGVISNTVFTKHKIRIYEDGNYNRYPYVGNVHINDYEFTDDERNIVTILEEMLFYGKAHMKRGHGIQLIPTHIIDQKCLVSALAETLQNRSNYKQTQERLTNNGITKLWLSKHLNISISKWLDRLFSAYK